MSGRKLAEAAAPEPDEVETPRPVLTDELDVLEAARPAAREDLDKKTRGVAERESLLAEARAREGEAKAAHLEAVRANDGSARGRLSQELFSATQEVAAQGQLLEEEKRDEHETAVRFNKNDERISELRLQRAAAVKFGKGVDVISKGFEHLAGVHVAGKSLEEILNDLTAQGSGREAGVLMRMLDDARRDFAAGLSDGFRGQRFTQ